jgi:hypothetical protein
MFPAPFHRPYYKITEDCIQGEFSIDIANPGIACGWMPVLYPFSARCVLIPAIIQKALR